jgi:hypothetical protein
MDPAPAVERELAFDLVKRGVLLAPVVLAVSLALWGTDGLLSAGYALGVVLVNFVLSASILAWSARRSPAVLMSAVMGGFLARMVLVALAVFAVQDAAWVHHAVLGITVVAAHLGLLVWEARYLSISLAFPALRPSPRRNP